MRLITKRIALSTAALVMAALPVLADEAVKSEFMGPAMQENKDQCLLVAANSCDRVGTLQGRINEIRNEINKGNAVYTNEELNILHKKLDDAIRQRDDAYYGGA